MRRSSGIARWRRTYLPIAMEPAKGVQIDAVVVSPHKFIGGPAASKRSERACSISGLQPRLQSDRNGLSKFKALLRAAAARSMHDLWQAIANAINRFTPDECRNYLVAAGYDAT